MVDLIVPIMGFIVPNLGFICLAHARGEANSFGSGRAPLRTRLHCLAESPAQLGIVIQKHQTRRTIALGLLGQGLAPVVESKWFGPWQVAGF